MRAFMGSLVESCFNVFGASPENAYQAVLGDKLLRHNNLPAASDRRGRVTSSNEVLKSNTPNSLKKRPVE